ncbi:MAG: cupredoxin domain-containing protein [Solirubrobacterales bacterium]
MKQRFSSAISVKVASMLAVGAVASLTVAPSLAAGEATEANSANTVYMKDGKQGLRFVAPKFIYSGEELTVLNDTDPHKVGPHTFSLVTRGSIPKTKKAQQSCFTPKHICKAIAGWHGVKGEGPPKKNPAEAGEAGWDALGNLHKKGDSWFTGNKPGTSFTQVVSAPGETTIYFMCAIHPWMHGSIEVRTSAVG